MKTMVRLTLATLLAATSMQALAVTATCQSLGIQDNVSASAGCQIGSTNNDTIGGSLQVNADHMFGFNDWIFGEKAFEQDQNIDVGLNVWGSNQAGLWFLNDAIWDIYTDVMIVLKGGNGNTSPNTYVGYRLDEGADWGSYLSPFSSGHSRKDLSHLTVYLRGGGSNSVPEPATLALIGIGLIGLAVMRRRRS